MGVDRQARDLARSALWRELRHRVHRVITRDDTSPVFEVVQYNSGRYVGCCFSSTVR
jgi:hypothetical protein